MLRNITRRRFLTASSALGVGVAGAAALAACGETKVVEKVVTQTVEVEVEKVVTKEVQVTVEKVVTQAMAAPQPKTLEFEFISDHVSGVRGKSTTWALANFQKARPDIRIKFTPQAGLFYETFAIRIAAGSAPAAALLEWSFFGAHQESFTQINDVLDRHPTFDGAELIFEPDSYTVNYDLDYPFVDTWQGAAFGLPYQGNVSGHYYNIDLYDQYGVSGSVGRLDVQQRVARGGQAVHRPGQRDLRHPNLRWWRHPLLDADWLGLRWQAVHLA